MDTRTARIARRSDVGPAARIVIIHPKFGGYDTLTFNWRDGEKADLGLGAEDVDKVEPLLVTYNKAGQVEGVTLA
jgi:hypothetical protein